MKIRLNIKSLIIVLLLFLSLFRIYIFSYDEFMNSGIILSLILILISKPDKEMIKENIVIIIFSLIIFLSTYIVKMNTYNFWNGIRYCLQFLALFFVTNRLVKKDGLKETIKNYYLISLFIVIIFDFTVLIGLEFDKTHYQNLSTYLFGNKFALAYLHMQTFGLMVVHDNLNNKKMNYKYIIYCIISIIMCKIVNCFTGIVGILVISLLLLLPLSDKLKKTLAKPKTIFIILFLIEILLIIGKELYDTVFVQYIIQNILHKGNSLNGRIIIYDLLPSVISQRFLLGYGYNSSIITIILGYGNAQNGLFQCILDLGIIGTVVFLINWYKCINIKFDNKNWALYCWLYSFMICSLVEVCLKFNFFMVLCILFNVGLLQKKEKIN